MKNISKSIFIKTSTCPTLGWLQRNENITEQLSLADRFRRDEGIEIGKRARLLYPDGLLIDETRIETASAITKKVIDDKNISVIFEGAFFIDGFTTRPDILEKNGESWKLIEVKSSVKNQPKYIEDMAYTAMILSRYGLNISNVSLLLISKDFRLGMSDQDFFVEVDQTEEVLKRSKEFGLLWQITNNITSASEKPEPKLIWACRQCSLFSECTGKDIEHHIFDIPGLREPKFNNLKEAGIVSIEDIPKNFSLTSNQSIVRDTVQTKRTFIKKTLATEFNQILWPAYYLDFETVMTAIPLYNDIAPYTQIPTQYSIRKCTNLGDIIDHIDYLADPQKDCRLELAQQLVDNLGEQGSIIVYSSFEKTIINALISLYPDLSIKLNSLINRIVDLQAIIKNNFYHIGFHGSYSIKSVLPCLIEDMSYDNLSIADGDSAMATFAYLATGQYKDEEIEEKRKHLLEYCKQDTLAMVMLHERLVKFTQE